MWEKPKGELFNWSGQVPQFSFAEALEPLVDEGEFYEKPADTGSAPLQKSDSLSLLPDLQENPELTEDDVVGFLSCIDPSIPMISFSVDSVTTIAII